MVTLGNILDNRKVLMSDIAPFGFMKIDSVPDVEPEERGVQINPDYAMFSDKFDKMVGKVPEGVREALKDMAWKKENQGRYVPKFISPTMVIDPEANRPKTEILPIEEPASTMITEPADDYDFKVPGYGMQEPPSNRITEPIEQVPWDTRGIMTDTPTAKGGGIAKEVADKTDWKIQQIPDKQVPNDFIAMRGKKVAHSNLFEVPVDKQGKGIGREALYILENRARTKGAEYFVFTNILPNAMGFYEKMGYTLEGGPHGIAYKNITVKPKGFSRSSYVTLSEDSKSFIKNINTRINEIDEQLKVTPDNKDLKDERYILSLTRADLKKDLTSLSQAKEVVNNFYSKLSPKESAKGGEITQEEGLKLAQESRKTFEDKILNQLRKSGGAEYKDDNLTYMITRSAKEKGKWQLTTLRNSDGLPMGDTQYNSHLEAIKGLADQTNTLRKDLPPEVGFGIKGGEYEFRYKLRLRDISSGTIPKDGYIGNDGERIARFNRPLSEEEIRNFELEPVGYSKLSPNRGNR